MKKNYWVRPVLILAVVALMALSLGADYGPQDIRITIGGGVARGVFQREIPINIPLAVEYDAPMGGCGSTEKRRFVLDLSAVLHLYYDSDTGESYARLKEISYSIILSASGSPEIRKIQD